jgi:hypothetical protein
MSAAYFGASEPEDRNMNRNWSVVAAVAVWATAGAFAQTPVGGAFTYQGQLKDQGQPATGPHNMQFRLYEADAGGTPLATYPPSGPTAVTVQDGLFTAIIDFGTAVFNGERRWLEVVVDGVTLAPRQELTAAPYALYALNGPGGGSYWQAGTNGIYYNAGNVGIGADASPDHLLEVAGDDVLISTIGGGQANLILNDTDGGTTPPGIAFWGNTQAGFYGPDSGDQIFAFRAGYPSPRVHDVHLRVYGHEDSQFIDLTHDGSDAIISGAGGDLVLNSTGANSAGLVLNGGTNGEMAFYTGSFLPANERMRITADGRIGIGSSSPARDLEVRKAFDGLVHAGVENHSSGASARAALAVGCDSSVQGTMLAHSNAYSDEVRRQRVAVLSEIGATGLSLAASDPAGDLRFYTGGFDSSRERMRIDAAGNVGVGTPTPGARLNAYAVGGTAVMGQSGTGTGVYGVSGSDAGVLGYNINNGAIGRLGYQQYGVYGEKPDGFAGYFDGDVHVTGDLTVDGSLDVNAWSLTGNAGTDPNVNFLGTTDNQPLVLKANGLQVMRLVPTATSPNVISGFAENQALSGVVGATIGGGGRPDDGVGDPEYNWVRAHFGTIAGGAANRVGSSGGPEDGQYGTVGGGDFNNASGEYSVIAGGHSNWTGGGYASIPGGINNQASGDYSLAAGRRAIVRSPAQVGGGDTDGDEGTFVWADSTDADFTSTGPNQFLVRATGGVSFVADAEPNTGGGLRIQPVEAPDSYANRTPNFVNGCAGNSVTSGVVGATIAGGGAAIIAAAPSQNTVTDIYGTVGGGARNVAGDNTGSTQDARYATVGGGLGNSASGDRSTVGGGDTNNATGNVSTISGGGLNDANGSYGTVGGGSYNAAAGSYSTVGGGYYNAATGSYSTVGGGVGNDATGPESTVGGGSYNAAAGSYSTVGGGVINDAPGDYSTVGGGHWNVASGYAGTVGGGVSNFLDGGNFSTVGGGFGNNLTGEFSTIGGGYVNTASGTESTVPGGSYNQAGGQFSFAAGRRAKVRDPNQVGGGDTNGDEGTFVWADSTNADFTSTGPNQFLIRATGGVGIGTTSPANRLDVEGGMAIGATYSGTSAAPANGLIVEGNVGVGFSNPASKLDVNGTIRAAGPGTSSPNLIIHDSNGSNDRPGIQFTNNSIHYICGDDASNETFGFYSVFSNNRTNDAILAICGKATGSWGKYLSLTHDGTDGKISTDDGTGDLVLNPGSGKVGIGLSDPSESLDTIGTARLRGIGTSTGTTVVADANGKLWKQSSSLRYKHNIADLPAAGDAVLDLRPVSFDWNSTGKPDIGLIAEEVEQGLPDLVIRDADGRPDGVRYDKVALYLLSVVKSQREHLASQREQLAAHEDQIVAQQAQIEAQHDELTSLRARLEKIETLLAGHATQPSGGVR